MFTVHYWPETEDEKLASALKTMWFRWKLQGMHKWTLRLDHFVKTGVIINSRLQLYVPKRPCLLCVTTEQQLCALQHLPWKLVWSSDPAESWRGWRRDGRGGGCGVNAKIESDMAPKRVKKNKHTLGFRFRSDFCDAFLHFFLQFCWPWCHIFFYVFIFVYFRTSHFLLFFSPLFLSPRTLNGPYCTLRPLCPPAAALCLQKGREREKKNEGGGLHDEQHMKRTPDTGIWFINKSHTSHRNDVYLKKKITLWLRWTH